MPKRQLSYPALAIRGLTIAQVQTLYEFAAALVGIVFAAIYLALFYLTFFYRWPEYANPSES